MAGVDDDLEYDKNYSSDDRTNELEQTLVQVAARVDPDAKNNDDEDCNLKYQKLYDDEACSSVNNKSIDGLKLKRKRAIEEKPLENLQDKQNWDNIPIQRRYERESNEARDTINKRKGDVQGTLKKGYAYLNEPNFEENAETHDIPQIKHYEDKNRSLGKSKSNEVYELPSRFAKRSENDIIGHAKVVATHYNALEEKGLEERSRSRILYLRNFHNWIKSMLINEYLTKVKEKKKYNEPIRVHDMCCGKGGDLLKWRKGNITHLICSDIASIALEHCKSRYQDMTNRSYRERNSGSIFSIEYIAADCSKVRLREKYKDASMKLDMVSCQFGFHYSFESLPQAECMMKNAAECLQPGGYFIGTIPDSNELLARVHKSGTGSFGNDVYNIVFECDTTTPPPFGAKYDFYLDGAVDCPEFLIYFPLLVKLAKKYGLKLVKKEKFYEFYERMKFEGRNLLTNVKSLETYPPPHGAQLVGDQYDDYEHAKLFIDSQSKDARVGTLSKSEWEATSLYLTFAFEKVKGTWNADGVAVYDI